MAKAAKRLWAEEPGDDARWKVSVFTKIVHFKNDSGPQYVELRANPVSKVIWILCLGFKSFWTNICASVACRCGGMSLLRHLIWPGGSGRKVKCSRTSAGFVWNFKGQVHSKRKIQSSSTHPNADGKSCKVSQPTKLFRSFTAKQCRSIPPEKWNRWGLLHYLVSQNLHRSLAF